MAASATSLPEAAAAAAANDETSNEIHRTRVARITCPQLQVFEPPRTVSELGTVDTEKVEHAQQKIASRNCFRRVREMPAAAKRAGGASDENMWDVIVHVLIRVPHVASIQNQRMIEQGAV